LRFAGFLLRALTLTVVFAVGAIAATAAMVLVIGMTDDCPPECGDASGMVAFFLTPITIFAGGGFSALAVNRWLHHRELARRPRPPTDFLASGWPGADRKHDER
jgi:hypothetical protein